MRNMSGRTRARTHWPSTMPSNAGASANSDMPATDVGNAPSPEEARLARQRFGYLLK